MNYFRSRNVSEALPELLDVLLLQPEVPSRNGTTRELRFPHIVIEKPCERIVTTPGRNALLVAQMAETMWILAGRNDVGWLSNYLPRAAEFSDDGVTWRGGYGPRIRHFRGVDQLKHVTDLLKEDRHTRRALISIYDAALDSKPGKDIPCNNWLHFLPRGDKLDLHVVARSNDVIWGWSGINAFEWSVLLEVVAGLTEFGVGEMHFSVSSFHLYERHYKKAARITRDAPPSAARQFMPAFNPSRRDLAFTDRLIADWFRIEEEIRTDKSCAAANVVRFPEPLMRSFLVKIEEHWIEKRAEAARARDLLLQNEGKVNFIGGIDNPNRIAVMVTDSVDPRPGLASFRKYVSDLHAAKDAAYGTSWKKRGQFLSILPNICRKSDRLAGGSETPDETQVDTAIDLFVYALKYSLWLEDEYYPLRYRRDEDAPEVTQLLDDWDGWEPRDEARLIKECERAVEYLCQDNLGARDRESRVQDLIQASGRLALLRWTASQDDYRGADHE